MKQQDRNKAWGFTLFADDFRVEMAGKVSLMGLFQSDMLLPSTVTFPVAIPKLCLLVMYYEIMGSITDDVTFRVTMAESQLVEFNVPRKDLLEQAQSLPDPYENDKSPPEEKERIFHTRTPVVLSPFTLASAGRLRVRAHYNDGSILKLGSMNIRQVEIDEFNKAAGSSGVPQMSPPN